MLATMWKLIVLVCITLFLTACSQVGNEVFPSSYSSESSSESSSVENPVVEVKKVYIPSQPLTMEETIKQYFEQQYNAYIGMQYIDISYLVDTDQVRNKNPLIWLEALIQRRRLISENQFCYVETNKYPYIITFKKEVNDERMEFWRKRGVNEEEEKIVHFTITGERERAYPPFLAVNSLHTMRLKQIKGIWKITFHYYPGSSKFRQNIPLTLPSEEEMFEGLKEEFKPVSIASLNRTPLPAIASPYNGERAVQYARTFTVSPNHSFYHINDWMGNCSNFTSQCLWYGFGTDNMPNIAEREKMTSQWYAGQGGGSPAWENVEHFWNYATAFKDPKRHGLHGEVVDAILELDVGGIIQTRSESSRNTDALFDHNLLLIDKGTLMLAQNSPDCFVYYSDLVNVDTRFFNPLYIIK